MCIHLQALKSDQSKNSAHSFFMKIDILVFCYCTLVSLSFLFLVALDFGFVDTPHNSLSSRFINSNKRMKIICEPSGTDERQLLGVETCSKMFLLCKVNGQVGFMVENTAKRAWSKLNAPKIAARKTN